MNSVDSLLEQFADLVAQRVVDRLRAGEHADMLDQRQSPLGARRHIAAIRGGRMPGVQVGRRWLARREDINAYAATLARRPAPRRGKAAELAEALGLRAIDGGRR